MVLNNDAARSLSQIAGNDFEEMAVSRYDQQKQSARGRRSAEAKRAASVPVTLPQPRVDWTKPGRVLSASLTEPQDHVVIWNARVVAFEGAGKERVAKVVWYGDLDLTDDRADLKALAHSRVSAIYILRPAKSHDDKTLDLDKAICKISPVGSFEIFKEALG
jgi:hypothetical protein